MAAVAPPTSADLESYGCIGHEFVHKSEEPGQQHKRHEVRGPDDEISEGLKLNNSLNDGIALDRGKQAQGGHDEDGAHEHDA